MSGAIVVAERIRCSMWPSLLLNPPMGFEQAASFSMAAELVTISSWSVTSPSGPGGQVPQASRPCVNVCMKFGIPEPALAMSRMIRSIATRMFCWRSASSGSRRKAVWPPASRP